MVFKEIRHTQNLYNGGYLAYWKIYTELISHTKDFEAFTKKASQQLKYLTGDKLIRKIKFQFFIFNLSVYTWLFVWCCILKPLGQFFSRRVIIAGRYRIVQGIFDNMGIIKSTQYKIFGIPFWYANDQTLSEEDIKDLMK